MSEAETEQQYRADNKFNGVEEPRYIFYGIPLDEEGLHDDIRRLRGNNKKKENPCVVF